MKTRAIILATAALQAAAVAAGAVQAAEPPAFAKDLSAFIDRLRTSPYAPPGFVVLAVHGDRTVFARAYGTRNLATGEPLTLDTPIYNASTTKAYTGVLAAILDEEGVLPITATLRDVWPSISLPAPLDARQITAEALLSHRAGLMEGGVQIRANGTGDITAADVPARLSRYAKPYPRTFRYSNFQPYVWSAMAETRTGVPWKEAVMARVVKPLGLTRTFTRVEDAPAGSLAACHARIDGSWVPVPPKPTPVLNAAGGMFSSGNDTAAFLKAVITDGRSANGAISATALRRSWRKSGDQDNRLWGLHRTGYGLGWDLGTYGPHRFVARSGGYPGCRSIALFVPEEGFGVVVMSLGDMAANTLDAAIVKQAVDLWTGTPGAEGKDLAADYIRTAADVAAKVDAVDPRLQGLPAADAKVLADMVGAYDDPRLGRFTIGLENGEAVVTFGPYKADLTARGGDDFYIRRRVAEDGELETFSLIRDGAGEVVAVMWDDDRFERVG